jgi:hypothetical protein
MIFLCVSVVTNISQGQSAVEIKHSYGASFQRGKPEELVLSLGEGSRVRSTNAMGFSPGVESWRVWLRLPEISWDAVQFLFTLCAALRVFQNGK